MKWLRLLSGTQFPKYVGVILNSFFFFGTWETLKIHTFLGLSDVPLGRSVSLSSKESESIHTVQGEPFSCVS